MAGYVFDAFWLAVVGGAVLLPAAGAVRLVAFLRRSHRAIAATGPAAIA